MNNTDESAEFLAQPEQTAAGRLPPLEHVKTQDEGCSETIDKDRRQTVDAPEMTAGVSPEQQAAKSEAQSVGSMSCGFDLCSEAFRGCTWCALAAAVTG